MGLIKPIEPIKDIETREIKTICLGDIMKTQTNAWWKLYYLQSSAEKVFEFSNSIKNECYARELYVDKSLFDNMEIIKVDVDYDKIYTNYNVIFSKRQVMGYYEDIKTIKYNYFIFNMWHIFGSYINLYNVHIKYYDI